MAEIKSYMLFNQIIYDSRSYMEPHMVLKQIICKIIYHSVGDFVEVWWQGDRKWYEGRVTGVDMDEKQFEVEYFDDGKVLTHNDSEYKVRMTV